MTKLMQLTEYLQVPNTAHILYFFEDSNSYLNNMIAYIKAGIEQGHHLLIIENTNIFNIAQQRINTLFSSQQQTCIHHMDNYLFYLYYRDFHVHSIVEHFDRILTPFLNEKINIRTWAHVEWKESDDIARQLEQFEKLADCSVNDMGLMSVCAYAASDISASLLTTMMRSHEYIMTDSEFVRSSLYRRSD